MSPTRLTPGSAVLIQCGIGSSSMRSGRPLVGKVNGSRITNLKELRPRSSGRSALRLLFAFDPRRDAIILVAADKLKANPHDPNRWYEEAIPHAERLYEIYLKERAEEEGQNQ